MAAYCISCQLHRVGCALALGQEDGWAASKVEEDASGRNHVWCGQAALPCKVLGIKLHTYDNSRGTPYTNTTYRKPYSSHRSPTYTILFDNEGTKGSCDQHGLTENSCRTQTLAFAQLATMVSGGVLGALLLLITLQAGC